MLGKVASKIGLAEKGIYIPNLICDSCGMEEEDANHIFASYLFARSIWWNVFVWLRIPFPIMASSLSDYFESIKSYPGSSKWRKIVQMVAFATTWRIWVARNKKTFDNCFVPVKKTMEMIKEDSFLWLCHRTKLPSPTWVKWFDFDVSDLL
ncbi:uncharacterized protein LOC110920065 [Helianthus annuus]|uniref:uncharacterized protein LOC110920065 n=1 Tax=Helianthus annuus TaxID=4232 RepID=UPI000B908CA6|nr:uncharacterized protein LOC110920065 [Helianthus annuus]